MTRVIEKRLRVVADVLPTRAGHEVIFPFLRVLLRIFRSLETLPLGREQGGQPELFDRRLEPHGTIHFHWANVEPVGRLRDQEPPRLPLTGSPQRAAHRGHTESNRQQQPDHAEAAERMA